MCSFLDPQYRQRVTTKEDFDSEVFTDYVFKVCDNEATESQQVLGPTQGQDQLTLTSSSIISQSRNKSKKQKSNLFDFDDDMVNVTDEVESVIDLRRKVHTEKKKK